MRIISGILKNKIIPSLKHINYRPTTSFIRESIFNILDSLNVNFADMTVLDLFAGTGSLAFEALSRGAKHATLIDNNQICHKIGNKFIQENKLNANYICLDICFLPKAPKMYNLIFIDPPYKTNVLTSTLLRLEGRKWINHDAILVCEMPKNKKYSWDKKYLVRKEKIYSSTTIVILQKN